MIIGISGKIKSGKNTVASIINDIVDNKFEEKCFADKIKDIVCLLIGCTRRQLENQDFKAKELGGDWSYWIIRKGQRQLSMPKFFASEKEAEDYLVSDKMPILHPDTPIDFHVVKENITPRILLQLMGTECGRNILHPNIWVNALFSEYEQQIGYAPGNYWCKCGECKKQFTGDKRAVRCENCSVIYRRWVITDLRFPNEFDAIKQRGGICIRVIRDDIKDIDSSGHASETSLDSYSLNGQFDHYIRAEKGDIENIKTQVIDILVASSIF